MKKWKVLSISVTLLGVLPCLLASSGDQSPVYKNCVKTCLNLNCTDEGAHFKEKAARQQDISDWILNWNCRDECRYHCMWQTVLKFEQRGFKIPKFHGKWPFHRFCGIQEPASAFASVLNLAANCYMFKQLQKDIWYDKEDPALLLFWRGFSLVCINTWMWSAVFHTRDKPFTEFMDYACALLMVGLFFVSGIVRYLHKNFNLCTTVVGSALFYFWEHCRYLHCGFVDYDYNMIVNIVAGVLGSLVWGYWSVTNLLAGRRYAAWMLAFISLSGIFLGLELYDYPPVLGWDSHALWHLCTAPLPLILTKFVMADLDYLDQQQKPGLIKID